MALADYYDRAALAAAQVIAGFDEDVFRVSLESMHVGISVGAEAEARLEGQALADLAVRLLARLYSRLEIRNSDPDAPSRRTLAQLALEINPKIELVDGARIGIAVGADAPMFAKTVFAGSHEFDALVSQESPQSVGESANPFGAGAAACLASAALFRILFLATEGEASDEGDLFFSALTGDRAEQLAESSGLWKLEGEATLIGLGAIGNAALWALSRAQIEGTLHLVDHETIEVSNLQRYVLVRRADEGASKATLAANQPSRLKLVAHEQRFERFVEWKKHRITHALVALDSADDRRRTQASLPLGVDNAWTQPGDLGVSRHARFGSSGACLACLYLPSGAIPNEDQLVADALGIADRLLEVRVLLHSGDPVERPLLDAVAAALGIEIDRLLPFEGRPLRNLYVEGLCGGAVIPLGQLGQPRQDVHVPLAHQSALAGVLLAAALVRRIETPDPAATEVTRINVLRPVGQHLTQIAAAAGDGRCICEDDDYRVVFQQKWKTG
ncbi:MAG: E2 ligase fold family C protein [Actinomycetota bacterium]|nr:E2 ligase fold family C protein [Actinomycetota bacterium]